MQLVIFFANVIAICV